jgi:hypothetical protein
VVDSCHDHSLFSGGNVHFLLFFLAAAPYFVDLHVDLLVACVIFSSSAASVMMTHNWCMLLETPLLPLAKSVGLSIAASTMVFCPVLSGSSNSPCRFSITAKLTGEFASLEEPTDDPDLAIILVLLVDRPDFAGLERQVEPEGST